MVGVRLECRNCLQRETGTERAKSADTPMLRPFSPGRGSDRLVIMVRKYRRESRGVGGIYTQKGGSVYSSSEPASSSAGSAPARSIPAMSSSVAGSVLVVPRWACNRFPADEIERGGGELPRRRGLVAPERDRGTRALDVRISCAIACSVLGFSLASCRLREKSARVQRHIPAG